MVEVIMPPTIGAAIGFMTSEPMPDSQRIGTKAGKDRAYGHELWPQTLDRAFNRRCLHIGIRQRLSALQLVFERFMEIDDHDDAGFDRDAKQRDIADGHSDAEVVVKQPLQAAALRSSHRWSER